MRQPSDAASIVPAGPLEAPMIASLLGETMRGSAWTEGAIADVLQSGGGFAHLAAGRTYGEVMPVAFALGRVTADEAELLGLGVLPDARRCGLGERLLESAMATAAGRGAVRMVLEVAETNAAALALYRKAGFERAGTRPSYYGDGGNPVDDAAILAKALSHGRSAGR